MSYGCWSVPQPPLAASQRPVPSPQNSHPSAGAELDEASTRGSLIVRPSNLPLRLWPPDGTGTLGLDPLSFAPRSYPRRTSEWGRTMDTGPELHLHQEPPNSASTRIVRPRVAPDIAPPYRACLHGLRGTPRTTRLGQSVRRSRRRLRHPGPAHPPGHCLQHQRTILAAPRAPSPRHSRHRPRKEISSPDREEP